MDKETYRAFVTLLSDEDLKEYHSVSAYEIKKRDRARMAYVESMHARELQERTDKFLQLIEKLEEEKKLEASEKSWAQRMKNLFY